MAEVKGYKVFNPDWTCKGFQYAVGETFEENVIPKCCDAGFHFCEKASDCFGYYRFDPENKVAEVLALGDVNTDGKKSCTNKIKIVREIPWSELLEIVNEGKDCTGFGNTGNWNTGNWNTGNWNTGDCNTGDCNTGFGNTGDRNTGNWNTGDWNTGDCNTGNWNTGNWNTGNWNTGNWNTGDCNTGDCNTGFGNTGDRNTGDWNKSSFNNGCFMTEEPKIHLFDRPSDWTYRDWINSKARYLLNQIPKNVVEWIWSDDMTDQKKAENPTYETTGGYLKVLDESECAQIWWNGLSESNKLIIKSLPNFDAAVFKECTGIDITK